MFPADPDRPSADRPGSVDPPPDDPDIRPAPDPVMAVAAPPAPTPASRLCGPARRRRRGHRGGIGPVPVRLQPGSPDRVRSGHSGLRGHRLPAVLGHVPHHRGSICRRERRSDDRDPGRHPRDDRLARRSVLGVHDVGRVSRQPPEHQRPVRGDRCRPRVGVAGWDPGVRAARKGLPPGGHRAARRVARTASRSVGRRRHRPGRWRRRRRADGRCRARQDPRAQGHGRRARRPAGRLGGDVGDDHPRRRPVAGGHQQGAGRRQRRVHQAERVLGRGRGPDGDDPAATSWQPVGPS